MLTYPVIRSKYLSPMKSFYKTLLVFLHVAAAAMLNTTHSLSYILGMKSHSIKCSFSFYLTSGLECFCLCPFFFKLRYLCPFSFLWFYWFLTICTHPFMDPILQHLVSFVSVVSPGSTAQSLGRHSSSVMP